MEQKEKGYGREQELRMEQMSADMDRIRGCLGKGESIEEISKRLEMDPEYAEFLFYFGIIG